ncbi:MAG TPA: hypothetical protein VGD67_08910 [Pseudonocardiaceae bacterium]
MSDFDVSNDGSPADASEVTRPVGRGSAAHGSVSATVGADGRLVELRIEPGPHIRTSSAEASLTALSAHVVVAVNAALDDLDATLRVASGDVGDRLLGDLGRVAEDFERALNQVAGDLAHAERRLRY